MVEKRVKKNHKGKLGLIHALAHILQNCLSVFLVDCACGCRRLLLRFWWDITPWVLWAHFVSRGVVRCFGFGAQSSCSQLLLGAIFVKHLLVPLVSIFDGQRERRRCLVYQMWLYRQCVLCLTILQTLGIARDSPKHRLKDYWNSIGYDLAFTIVRTERSRGL